MAVQDPTTWYGWNLPLSGGDAGSWGTLLNAIIGDDSTGIDAVLKAVSDVADAALPVAGGTLTGNVKVFTETHTAVNLGTGLSGTVNLDMSLGNVFYGACAGAITITFSNVPASGNGVFCVLELTSPTSVTMPGAVTFCQDSVKSIVASKSQVYCMFTRDGGTKWRAAHMANMTL